MAPMTGYLVSGAAALMLSCLAPPAGAAHDEVAPEARRDDRAAPPAVIDRILAVVDGQVITLSDVHAAIDLGLVNTSGAADPVGAALDRLIERALTLGEVERYGPLPPSDADVAARMAAIAGRFATQADLDRVLDTSGLTAERLRAAVRDDLRILAYLNQRFASVAEPTDAEVVQYYRGHEAAFTEAGALRPFSEVRLLARERLAAERRAALIGDWIAGLRRRAEVTLLYLPAA
ncbi:MAG: SurA N-terminal domain-containing protein [Acidobacteria bacterium]|nr:SurA N-terminal domain-containing protein [Acidobacteriota bacterium]